MTYSAAEFDTDFRALDLVEHAAQGEIEFGVLFAGDQPAAQGHGLLPPGTVEQRRQKAWRVLQGLVGQPADEATVEQAREDAHAERVRVLRPGQAVTLEFDGARLNVEVDESNTIVALRCG